MSPDRERRRFQQAPTGAAPRAGQVPPDIPAQ